MSVARKRDVPSSPRTYTSVEEFEKSVFPKARRRRLRAESSPEATEAISSSVLAVLRRHLTAASR